MFSLLGSVSPAGPAPESGLSRADPPSASAEGKVFAPQEWCQGKCALRDGGSTESECDSRWETELRKLVLKTNTGMPFWSHWKGRVSQETHQDGQKSVKSGLHPPHRERLFPRYKREGLSVKSLDNSSSILKWESCLGTPWPNISYRRHLWVNSSTK